ncbi:acyl-CoA thioester hydrolase, YbgC/YbaW family [Desulfosporosinus acidiphilus SJ4]|uniref:Acyl-CoA thioester hydrolase, YbgC/YbaW family n=1 Tax=Desulfosporosinus acidiphilus (strain DSM 22704 / JCM 16185 / SJ4) TaxID=646529 RepID=I4D7Q5_DESAJ|nr:thioesterase family protein [Desulfosporosinus acidiphilus]AFM41829.1 acyl-CoA thioester hydrolase, YbgC/YbaW family [Desulfosporosinus acidiphilus SJ4]
MGLSGTSRLRVRYAETDQMGIVYHANYLIWFEVGRTELFREINLPYTRFEEQGFSLAVIEANCRYRKPARYDDDIKIVTTIDKVTTRSVTFSYLVYRDETLLAQGKTVHLFINKEGRHTDIRDTDLWRQLQMIISNN